MKVLELFAGTRSIGKAFENRGHQVFSVEWDKNFENIDLYADILTVTTDEILNRFGRPDVIWASPDCSTFSIAAISHHRRKNPVTGNLDPIILRILEGEPMTVKDYYEVIRDIERLAALVDAEGAVTLDHDDSEQIWALLLDYKDLLMAKEVG